MARDALRALGRFRPAAVHVISLLVFSALCLVVAARFFRWE